GSRSAARFLAGGVSSPAGGGTPGYQAGLPRCGYGQASAARAGPAPVAWDAWHIRIPAPGGARAASLGVGPWAVRAAARSGPAASAGPAAWAASAALAWGG